MHAMRLVRRLAATAAARIKQVENAAASYIARSLAGEAAAASPATQNGAVC